MLELKPAELFILSQSRIPGLLHIDCCWIVTMYQLRDELTERYDLDMRVYSRTQRATLQLIRSS